MDCCVILDTITYLCYVACTVRYAASRPVSLLFCVSDPLSSVRVDHFLAHASYSMPMLQAVGYKLHICLWLTSDRLVLDLSYRMLAMDIHMLPS